MPYPDQYGVIAVIAVDYTETYPSSHPAYLQELFPSKIVPTPTAEEVEVIGGTMYIDTTGTGAFSLNREASTAVGTNSVAMGNSTRATGSAAVAIGTASRATGDNAFAAGFQSRAVGDCSQAFGYDATAFDPCAHAEGYSTRLAESVIALDASATTIINTWTSTPFLYARGNGSHAEGYDTLAIANYSHAEGYRTYASDTAAHSEGSQTKATGTYSHAEGYQTQATGSYSHAEGKNTVASDQSSHAQGVNTFAYGDGSHAEGNSYWLIDSTIASGSNENIIAAWETSPFTLAKSGSHAEGRNTLALSQYCHAEGFETRAIVNYSHAEGGQTKAAHVYSHVEGSGTQSSRAYQHVQGRNNLDNADAVDIVGWGEPSNKKNISTLYTTGDLHLKGDIYTAANDDGSGGTKIPTSFVVSNELLTIS